jgi:hypothetical protein
MSHGPVRGYRIVARNLVAGAVRAATATAPISLNAYSFEQWNKNVSHISQEKACA